MPDIKKKRHRWTVRDVINRAGDTEIRNLVWVITMMGVGYAVVDLVTSRMTKDQNPTE